MVRVSVESYGNTPTITAAGTSEMVRRDELSHLRPISPTVGVSRLGTSISTDIGRSPTRHEGPRKACVEP